MFRTPQLGRGEELIPLTEAVPAGLGTARITLARRAGDVAVTEWWANEPGGLEQGFTVETRPAGIGPLEVRQTVATSLRATLSFAGDAVVFADSVGEQLRFGQPAAWDADGRALPMRLTLEGDTLGFVVNDEAARYPVTIDPTWTQKEFLQASAGGWSYSLGWSVAIAGDLMVVGAPYENSAATGVNGNAADSSAYHAGAAYVFARVNNAWVQRAYVKASNTRADANFGWSVAVSGETVVVGSPDESSATTGVDGDATDSSARSAGAVYVFAWNGTTLTQQAYLKASNTGQDDQFGRSVAIAGETVVVGARGEDSGTTGVDGDQANNSALESGAVYVFRRSGTTWTQDAYLKASNTRTSSRFGTAVAIAGDTVVVGASGESSGAVGVNGNQADTSALGSGAAYVFVRGGTTWTQQAYLKASNTQASDSFGSAVAIANDTVVVSAPSESSASAGVNGIQTDNSASSAGAAYVFVRNGTAWAQQAYLKASNPDSADFFGTSVAIALNTIIVGSPGESSGATGVDGNQTDNAATAAGAAYLFRRVGTTWTQHAYLKASNTSVNAEFGSGVAAEGNTAELVVGAPWATTFTSGSFIYGAAYTYVTPVPGDFDGDGYPDLLFAQTNGAAYLWKLLRVDGVPGPVFSGGNWVPSGTGPIAAVGDLTGDGGPDIVLRPQSDDTLTILRTPALAVAWTTHVNTNWRPVATADVNADGRNDLVWQGLDGRVVVWFMSVSPTGVPLFVSAGFVMDTGALANTQQPLQLTAAQRISAVVPDPLAAGVNLIVQDTTTGDLLNLFVQPDLSAPSRHSGLPTSVDPNWQIRAAADYDGDGQADLLFQHVTTGDLYVWYVVNNTFSSGAYLNPSRVNPVWMVVGPR